MFLGIDLGTSGVKLILIDRYGKTVGITGCSYPFYGTEEGFFEHEPQDWKTCIIEAAKQLRLEVENKHWEKVEAIGLSAQMPTLVVLGKDGRVLDRSITWYDARAEEQGSRLLKLWGKDRHYEKTGVKLDGRYLVPMHLWLKENKAEVLSQDHYILSAKDYLFYWMTGEIKTEPSTASGFAIYNINEGIWDEELCGEADISIDMLPEIEASSYNTKKLTEDFKRALCLPDDVTLCQGTADSVAGVLGMGANEPGIVCQICGSSTAILAVCSHINTETDNKFFVTPLARPDYFAYEADILSTGESSKWLANLFGINVSELSSIARISPPGSEGVFFTPYLAGGEQGVLWNPALSGFIMGLSTRHDKSHIVRAHYEGICYEAKRCIDSFTSKGFKAKKVLMTGPVTKDGFFMQLMADILDLQCIASAEDNASAYGAAVLAGISINKFEWNFTSAPAIIENNISYYPNPEKVKLYNLYYKQYLEISRYSKLKFSSL